MIKEFIADEDILLRRVPISPSYIKPDNTITSLSFKPSSRDKDGLSVEVERLTTHERAVVDTAKYRLVGISTEIPRSLGLDCIHDPLVDNLAHALITGNITRGLSRKLARSAKWII